MSAGALGRFVLQYEWEDADGVSTAELAATWARLEIWAGNECITQVEDQASKSARRGIYCSLHPLAEWAAYNWWLLNVHYRLAGSVTHPSQLERLNYPSLRRHSLRSAGDGFRWPNLAIIPEGGTTRLVWSREHGAISASPIRFITEGVAYADPRSVEATLAGLIENVVARLEEQGINDSALEKEWSAVIGADTDEQQFCVAAARLGLDPYSVDEETAELITTIGSKLDAQLLGDFLDAVNPASMPSGVAWIADSNRVIQAIAGQPNPSLETFRVALNATSNGGRPWELGWSQARQVREAIGIKVDEPFDVDDLVALEQKASGDRGLEALGGVTTSGAPALVMGRSMSVGARRFATARALWHYANAKQPRFLLTTAHTDKHKVERAFAAELLAPAKGVEGFIQSDGQLVDIDEIEAIGEHFGVSPFVIRHQVENQLSLVVAD